MHIMTIAEFQAEMKKQGLPPADCTFECPRCKTLQSANDMIKAGAGEDFDAVQGYIGFSCIGRFDKTQGCDWTLGGLLRLHELEVIDADGKHHPHFMPVGR